MTGVTESRGKRPNQPILVIGKASTILDSVAARPEGMAWRDVQRATGLPASTTLRLLQNLAAEGFLDLVDGRYFIGLTLLRWARSRRSGAGIAELAQPELVAIRDATGETAVLFLRHDRQRVIVGLAETRHEVVRLVGLGQVMPLHAGSAGKVFLAFDDALDPALLGKPLRAYTEHTITDPDALAAELRRIRERGWAESISERDTGTVSISAPVYDHTGSLAAVIGIGAPVQRFNDTDRPAWAEAVVASARRLSAELGHVSTDAEHLPAGTDPLSAETGTTSAETGDHTARR